MGPATHYKHSGKAPLAGVLLTLTGFVLWAIWGIEAIIIVVTATALSHAMTDAAAV